MLLPHQTHAEEQPALPQVAMKIVCLQGHETGLQDVTGENTLAWPDSCPMVPESMPVVRTALVLVAPNLESVTQAQRIMKKGIVPEVLEFPKSREYPFNAIKLGLQGTTTVKINLLPDGQAESVRVRKSSGHHLLDDGLADLKVSGRFNSQDLTSFLRMLEEALPVKVTRVNPHLVIVERAKTI